jgi:hypothetical protein
MMCNGARTKLDQISIPEHDEVDGPGLTPSEQFPFERSSRYADPEQREGAEVVDASRPSNFVQLRDRRLTEGDLTACCGGGQGLRKR